MAIINLWFSSTQLSSLLLISSNGTSSFIFWRRVRISLTPVDVCNASISARTPRQARKACSHKTWRVSVEERGFPAWSMVSGCGIVDENGKKWTKKSWWYPTSDSFSVVVPPLSHLQQLQFPPGPMWHADSLCIGLSERSASKDTRTFAPCLLSRRKVYSILYNSTLILPSNRRGERLLRLLKLLTVVGENKKRYYYTVEYREYI